MVSSKNLGQKENLHAPLWCVRIYSMNTFNPKFQGVYSVHWAILGNMMPAAWMTLMRQAKKMMKAGEIMQEPLLLCHDLRPC